MAELGSGVRRPMQVVAISSILLFVALVRQASAHCGFPSAWKLAAGEGDSTVDLRVECRQEDAVLAWSDGDLPYLQEVTLYSSCIDPTNTSVAAITGSDGTFFGTSSELDPKQLTVQAFPGRECSYYGCYERQQRISYYTFSTVSCVWTEPARLAPATITSTPQPTESTYVYLLPSSIAPNDITSGTVSRSLYLTSSSSDILPSRVYQTPTPSVISVPSTIITSKVDDENSSGLAPQNTSWMLPPSYMNLTMTTPPAYMSSTVSTNYIVSSQQPGVLTPMVLWVIPVVLLGFLIIAVAALIATCHIAAQRRTHQKYAVRNGIFDNEDKIDLNFYPVSTCIPLDTLSIRSNVTVCNQLESSHKESNHYGVQDTAAGLSNMQHANMELNKAELLKGDANHGGHFSLNPDITNKCLETDLDDSGNYVEMSDTSNTNPNVSTSFQSTVSTTAEISLPTSDTTVTIDLVSTCTTATKKEKQKSNSHCGTHRTPVGYVLEEKALGIDNTMDDKHQTQELVDNIIWNYDKDDSDADESFVKIEDYNI